MKYLTKEKNKWYYNANRDGVNAGIIKRKVFDNEEDAYAYAEEQNKIFDEWLKDKRLIKELSSKSRVKDLLRGYYASVDYTSLAPSTKSNYKLAFEAWLDRRIGGIVLRDAKLSDFTTPMCQRFYEDRAKDNVVTANQSSRAMRMLFNFGIRMGYLTFNPWAHLKRHKVKPRKVMWERHHVRAFLNTAFSKWRWRNVGVLFYCLYEWGQRPGDIVKMKWNSIDWSNRCVIIQQQKRGVTVKLPISNGLFSLLRQQHDDYGIQDYIAPQMTRVSGKWVAYSKNTLNNICQRIMSEANIPDHLQLRDLRRTAITETVEGGADAVTLMQLSGHQSLHSLTPYIVHTLTGSKKAQTIRGYPDQLMDGEETDADNLLNGQRSSRKFFKKPKPQETLCEDNI